MRNLKRALSLALASVMLLGMMVVGSGASYADVTSEENQEAIEVLQAIGVMVGDNNGNFNPDALVNREQMATIMCQLLDYTVSTYTGTTNFTDVSAWALPYVEACYANGIIAGYSDTQFGGTDNVTTAQAALMIMKALGYFQEAGDFGGDWVVSTVRQGAQIRLFDGVTNGANEALTRNDVAQMVLNGLEAECVEISSHDLVSDGNGGFTTKANYTSRTSTDAKYSTIDIDQDADNNEYINLGEELFSGDLVKTGERDSFGRPATTWTFEGDKIGTYADTADQILVADKAMGLDEMLTGAKYFNLTDDSTVDNNKRNNRVNLDNDANVATDKYINALDASDNAANAAYNLVAGDVVEIFKNQYGFVTDVVVSRYTLAVVDDVNDNVSAEDKADGTKYYISLAQLDETALAGGKIYNDDDIGGYTDELYTEGNVIAVALSREVGKVDDILDSYALTTQAGGISAFKQVGQTKPYVVMDGSTYYLSGNRDASTIADENAVDYADGTYNLYVDANGYVLGIEGTYAVDLKDVYYLTGAVAVKDGTFNTATYYAQAVSLADGTVSEIQLEKSSFIALTGVTPNPSTPEDWNDLKALANDATALYSFTDNDKNLGADNKANNGKFTAEAYTGNGAEIKAPASKVDTLAGFELKKSDTSASLAGHKVYLNSDTKYVLVSEDKDNIDVDFLTGGANVTGTAAMNAYVVYTQANANAAKVAAYIIFADAAAEITGNASNDDVVYLAATPSIKVKDGWQTDLYKLDGTILEDVVVDAIEEGKHFYTYTEKDGVITLADAVDNVYPATGRFDYDDQDGKIENQLVDSIYNNGITLVDFRNDNSLVSVVDVNAANAVIIDTRAETVRDADPYKGVIDTLGRLESAIEQGDVVVDMYLDDENVLFIAVVSMNRADVTSLPTNLGAASVPAGFYTGTGDALAAAGVTGCNSTTSQVIVFKFLATNAAAGDYELVIKDSSDDTYYSEKHNATFTAGSAHFFFLDVDGAHTNGTGSNTTTTGDWDTNSDGYSDGPMDAGSYTYTITYEGTTLVSGSFTIE